jgi:hypothetical protein
MLFGFVAARQHPVAADDAAIGTVITPSLRLTELARELWAISWMSTDIRLTLALKLSAKVLWWNVAEYDLSQSNFHTRLDVTPRTIAEKPQNVGDLVICQKKWNAGSRKLQKCIWHNARRRLAQCTKVSTVASATGWKGLRRTCGW